VCARNSVRFLILGTLLAVATGIVALGVGHSSALGKGPSAALANSAGKVEGTGVSSATRAQETAPTPTPPPIEATAAPLPRLAPPMPLPLPAAIPQSPRLTNHPKLAPPLSRLLDTAIEAGTKGEQIRPETLNALPDDLRPLVQTQLMRINAAGEVQVYIEVENVDGGIVEALAAAGIRVERADDDALIVQAQVTVLSLDKLAAIDGVRAVRLPDYGVVQAGSVVTEGDSIIKADAARSSFRVSGAGVRVGVISDGVGGLAAAEASSDLPPSVDITTCNVISGSDPTLTGAEGTAMLEIVHDIAPNAELWFGHFGMATSLDFNAAVDCLAAHTDVVVDDIGWFNDGPYDGTSSVSTNTSADLNRTTNPIRAYSTAVGNDALSHYREPYYFSGYYVGDYPNGDYWYLHQFKTTASTTSAGIIPSPSPFNRFRLNPGGSAIVLLQWNDPWGFSSNNYDLLWGDGTTTTLCPANIQDGVGNDDFPIESCAIQNNGSAVADYDIYIGNYRAQAATRTFDMFILCSRCVGLSGGVEQNFNTLTNSVSNQSDAGGGVISVGAIDEADPGNDTIEAYSSRGPTIDGRTKPDVTAIDGVCVTGSGGFGDGSCQGTGRKFYGTSAAAPHVAGVAALLLQCRPDLKAGEPGDNPSADRATLRNLILNNAVDLGTSGMDNTFGTGRLDAFAAGIAAGCASTGGIQALPDAPESALQPAESSPGSSPPYAAIAGAAAAGLVPLSAGGWYAMRRRRAR
jgi:hypothetical protein